MSKFSIRGITLIELLVTVAVLAIITAIAYPSFMDGLRKSRRAEAIKGLLTMQLKQEEYRITNSEYLKQVSFAAKTELLGSPSSAYYNFSVVDASTSSTTYKLQASASGPQTGDTGCTILTIDKSDSKGTNADCWK